MKIIFALVLVAVAAVYVDALRCYECTDCATVEKDKTATRTCRAGAYCLEKKVEEDGKTTVERRCCGQQCPRNDDTVKDCKTCRTDLCNADEL